MTLPSLRSDILKAIIPLLNVPNNQYETIKSLKKFMDSGKEPFEAVLKYFSHVNSVAVHDDHLTVFVERINRKNSDEIDIDIYEISYNFAYLNDILKVISKFNKVLIIEHYPSVPKGKRCIAFLTQKNLKSITFSNYNILPIDYYKFFKEECHFEEMYLFLDGISQTSLIQYFDISLSHYTICTYMNADFWEEHIKAPFYDVKSISLQQCHYFLTDSISSPGDVYNYFECLSKCLPNLENLHVYFETTLFANDKWNPLSWQEVYANMQKFDPIGFSNISSKIKGSLKFRIFELSECFLTAIKEIGKNAKVEFDNDKKQMIKKFDINDGLVFEFILQFCDKKKQICDPI